jgi:hypothetical protein
MFSALNRAKDGCAPNPKGYDQDCQQAASGQCPGIIDLIWLVQWKDINSLLSMDWVKIKDWLRIYPHVKEDFIKLESTFCPQYKPLYLKIMEFLS